MNTLEIRNHHGHWQYRVRSSSGRILVEWQDAPDRQACVQQGRERFGAVENRPAIATAREIVHQFPDATIGIVGQDGIDQTPRHKGVTVTLHYLPGEDAPACAEVFGGDHYADVGLWWRDRTLVDYDGVFDLPDVVATALRDEGFNIDL